MKVLRDQRPILGIDPTHDGVVFAFFEDGTLVDFGTTRSAVRRALDRLVNDYGPEVVVIEDGHAPKCERRPRMRKLLGELMAHAQRRGIAVLKVSRSEARTAWEKHGITRKQAVAVELVKLFPDLAPVLPPPRKAYRREVPRERIFGTVALVVHGVGTTPEVLRDRTLLASPGG